MGILQCYNPSDRTMALGSTQPLTEMSKDKGKAVPLQACTGPEGSWFPQEILLVLISFRG